MLGNIHLPLTRGAGHWARTTCIVAAGVLLVLAAYVWAFGWFGAPGWRYATGDLVIYTDATGRLFSGGPWFLDRQLHGPYEILGGDVLYPPASAWFFAPWLVLPHWTFVAIPAAITAWVVYRHRPAVWTWPLMALCLLWPTTGLKVLSANPNVWVTAAVALGTLYGWPAALVLLKPSLLPFALFGIRTTRWWVATVGLAVLSLPFLAATLAYPQVILDSRGSGLTYSLWDVPMVLIPALAWLGQRRRGVGRGVSSGAGERLGGVTDAKEAKRRAERTSAVVVDPDPH